MLSIFGDSSLIDDMSQQPVPVEPLNYFTISHHSWLPLVKVAAIMGMALGIVHSLRFFSQLTAAFTLNYQAIGWSSTLGIVLECAHGLASIAMILFGLMCLRLHPMARKWLLISVSVVVIISAISMLISAYFLYGTFIRGSSISAGLGQIGMLASLEFGKLIGPLMLIWILTRNEVKNIFHEGRI
jgi:hypothetical protein